EVLKGFKAALWIDFPFAVTDDWNGKLSCDLTPETLAAPDFGERVHSLSALVQEAGRTLELFARLEAEAPPEPVEVIPGGGGDSDWEPGFMDRLSTKSLVISKAA